MFLNHIPVLVLITCQVGFLSAETVKVHIQPVCIMDNGATKYGEDIHVSLWEEDFSSSPLWDLFDSDDFLDAKQVPSDTPIQLEGSEIEIFSLEPYLIIRHSCFGYGSLETFHLSRVTPDDNNVYNMGRFVITRNGYIFDDN